MAEELATPYIVFIGILILGVVISIAIGIVKSSKIKGDKAARLFSFAGWFLVSLFLVICLLGLAISVHGNW